MLQWGRGCSSAETIRKLEAQQIPTGFNGAADVHPRKLMLHCGHRVPVGASMGPRMFIRGNSVRAGRPCRLQRLQWGRGCSSAETLPSVNPTSFLMRLQWGRGCSSAETISLETARAEVLVLQWGRGCSSAETPWSAQPVSNAQCFNGAADVHPRKHPDRRRIHPLRAASMGPRMFIRGNGDGSCWETGCAHASMGPRMFIRGNSESSSGSRRVRTRFNGAADVHPRKRSATSRNPISR